MIYILRMNIDYLYPYFLIVSIIVSILAAIVAILLNTLRSAETKEKIHLFPYSIRKLFIEELKQVSDVTYDLFERRLLKNKNTDGVVIALTGTVLMALIILGTIFVPSDLKIVVYYFTFNYYFFEYVIIGFIVLSFLFFVPLELDIKIHVLMIARLKHFRGEIEGKTGGSKFDVNKNERRQIRLYHYIKYFSFVSALTIIGLFFQLLIVGITQNFYFQTNLAIALIPFIIFAIFLFIIFMIGRFRLSELYDLESTFLMQLALLPGTNKKLMLKTSDIGLFSDKPQICYVEGIGKKLKVHYKWDDDIFISYVKWKHVIAFGFPDLKLLEAIQKRAIEEKNNSDSQSDS